MKKLAVFFGGESLEHEVSVITALQLMKHVDKTKYELIPVYADKRRLWWSDIKLSELSFFQQVDLNHISNVKKIDQNIDQLKLICDVAILCFHGSPGENGAVQGLLDLSHIPYQGPGVFGSASTFDKIATRQILKAEEISQPEYIWFTAQDWKTNKDKIEKQIAQELTYPVFVKPANAGSSIGVQQVKDSKALAQHLVVVFAIDDRAIVENSITDCIEVNVSVLGDDVTIEVSETEQPIKSSELLSFADKYENGGKKSGMANATRRIPAPIAETTANKVKDEAKKIFRLFNLSGVVRIDFFVNPSTEEVFVTEINTIPGSMSFYLWEATGKSYAQLIDRLVEIAERRAMLQSQKITSHNTNILQKARI